MHFPRSLRCVVQASSCFLFLAVEIAFSANSGRTLECRSGRPGGWSNISSTCRSPSRSRAGRQAVARSSRGVAKAAAEGHETGSVAGTHRSRSALLAADRPSLVRDSQGRLSALAGRLFARLALHAEEVSGKAGAGRALPPRPRSRRLRRSRFAEAISDAGQTRIRGFRHAARPPRRPPPRILQSDVHGLEQHAGIGFPAKPARSG